MINRLDTKKEFALIKRARSFVHAGRGIWVFIKTTPNAWVQLSVVILAILFGLFFSITKIEWLFVILSGGLLLAAEAFNTAIEIDINLTSPDFHPYARDTKDVAAGAVLITALTAGTIWLFVFVPYFLV